MANDENQSAQVPAGPAATFEDEEKAMRSGKGRMLVGMVVAALAAIGLLVFFVLPDASEAFRKYGTNVNGLDLRQHDPFWTCALEGANMAEIRNNQALTAQLHGRAQQHGKRWTTHVGEQCIPKLEELQRAIDELLPPDEFTEVTLNLSDAVKNLRRGWSDLVGYVNGIQEGETYDEARSAQAIEGISKGWYDYRRNLSDINRRLREKLGDE